MMNLIFSTPVFLIGIVFMIIGMIISGILKSKFQKYSQIPLSSNFSGKEIDNIIKSPGVMRTGTNVTVMKRKRLYLLRFIRKGLMVLVSVGY